MVQGEAVKSFTVMFLKMWAVSEKMENMAVYLRPGTGGTGRHGDTGRFGDGKRKCAGVSDSRI